MGDEKREKRTTMRAVYLTGDRVYLRAAVAGDKDDAVAWGAAPFPISAERAESTLKEDVRERRGVRRLMIVRTDGDELVGGVRLASRDDDRTAWLGFSMAPALPDAEADELRAEALRLLVPWLRDQVELMVVRVAVGADGEATITAAEALGMVRSARLREFDARPGGRVDRLVYEALNPRWEVRDA